MAGEVTEGVLGGTGACARGTLIAGGLAAPPKHLTAHGGLPPALARALPVTGWPRSHPPTASARERRPFSRRSSLEPRTITVNGARCTRVTAWWRCAPSLTVIVLGSLGRRPGGWPGLEPSEPGPQIERNLGWRFQTQRLHS
jgi:hypothetical protein